MVKSGKASATSSRWRGLFRSIGHSGPGAITLTVTPLRKLSGWHSSIKLRRMFGLYAFFYACLHFTTYIWLDQFFDLASIYKDVIERPFITVSFPSFLLMIPLAITSTNAMVRRLGGKRWQRLHRLVYVIAIGGVIHYWWLVKKDITDPAIYAFLLTLLLAYRVMVAVRKRQAIDAAPKMTTESP